MKFLEVKMNTFFDPWQTLYEGDFSADRFLYHYTSFDKAIKILHGKKLKFSKLNLMNDTLEAKPKLNLQTPEDVKYLSDVIQHFGYTNNHFLQLLCMSEDKKTKISATSQRVYYSDYSGRGFALPRMWAQYADNNNGLCIIFKKNKLISLIKKSLDSRLIHNGSVEYVSHYVSSDIVINIDNVIEYVKRIKKENKTVRTIDDLTFLNRNKNFVKYNYFSKLDDWGTENEYRFLAYGDEDYYIDEIFDVIAGIVVGEQIDEAHLRIIKNLCEDKFELMKISFNCDGCNLQEII